MERRLSDPIGSIVHMTVPWVEPEVSVPLVTSDDETLPDCAATQGSDAGSDAGSELDDVLMPENPRGVVLDGSRYIDATLNLRCSEHLSETMFTE